MIKKRIFNFNLEKLITVLLIVFPIFSRYSSIVAIIDLSEFMAFLFLLYIIARDIKNVKIDINLLFFLLYIFSTMLILIILYGVDVYRQVIGTSLRLIYLYVILNVLGYNYFDTIFSKKILISVTMVLSVYAIIQYIFAHRGIILTTYIPGLNPMQGTRDLKNIDDILLEQMNYGLQFRPRSLLNEPAHLATYIISALTVILFGEGTLSNKNLFIALFFSFTCLITRSSTAIIMLFIIWALYFLQSGKSRRNIRLILLIILIAIFALIISYSRDDSILKYFFSRTFGNSKSFTGIINSTRFSQVKETFDGFLRLPDMLIGRGTIRVEGYLPGYFRLFYDFGILGVILYFYWIFKSAKRVTLLQKSMFYIFIIMNIGTEVLFGNFIFLYLPFIFNNKRNIISKNRN